MSNSTTELNNHGLVLAITSHYRTKTGSLHAVAAMVDFTVDHIYMTTSAYEGRDSRGIRNCR